MKADRLKEIPVPQNEQTFEQWFEGKYPETNKAAWREKHDPKYANESHGNTATKERLREAWNAALSQLVPQGEQGQLEIDDHVLPEACLRWCFEGTRARCRKGGPWVKFRDYEEMRNFANGRMCAASSQQSKLDEQSKEIERLKTRVDEMIDKRNRALDRWNEEMDRRVAAKARIKELEVQIEAAKAEGFNEALEVIAESLDTSFPAASIVIRNMKRGVE